MVKFVPSQPMGVKKRFAFIIGLLICLIWEAIQEWRKCLLSQIGCLSSLWGPVDLNMKLTQVDPCGVLEPQL